MAKFIVIDGLDGCGKATQVKKLAEELKSMGKKVYTLDFPCYDSDSSAAVKMYLQGKINSDASKLNPYMCASFYAVDRFINFEQEYNKYFSEDDNTIILADRYLSANIIHQGGKLSSRKERYEFIRWCYDYECRLVGLPVEDITIVLTVPPEISQGLLEKRYNGDSSKKDIHESNVGYLNDCYNRVLETIDYMQYVSVGDKKVNWKHIDCTDETGKGIKNSDVIANEIMKLIEGIIS